MKRVHKHALRGPRPLCLRAFDLLRPPNAPPPVTLARQLSRRAELLIEAALLRWSRPCPASPLRSFHHLHTAVAAARARSRPPPANHRPAWVWIWTVC